LFFSSGSQGCRIKTWHHDARQVAALCNAGTGSFFARCINCVLMKDAAGYQDVTLYILYD